MLRRSGPLKRKTPLKRGGPLRRIAVDKLEEWKEYLKERAEYLRDFQKCWACRLVCAVLGERPLRIRNSSDVHHKLRRGKLLRAKEHWMPVCRRCHDYIEGHKAWSREVGFILYK